MSIDETVRNPASEQPNMAPGGPDMGMGKGKGMGGRGLGKGMRSFRGRGGR